MIKHRISDASCMWVAYLAQLVVHICPGLALNSRSFFLKEKKKKIHQDIIERN
ncbi:hypothetical protein M430DRAFT_36089, partial [Amorphotheca resinae ATCC 22711]